MGKTDRSPLTPEQLAAWQAMADEATPGEWQWYGNVRQKEVYLATVDRGRVFVMGFERWGMRGAQPRFQMRLDGTPGSGIMRGLDDLGAANGPQMFGPHRNDFAGIGHPDARLIAAAPTIVRSLLAEVHRLRAEVEAADEGMAAILDGTFSVGDGTAQREIERLRAEVESLAPHALDTETEPDAEVLTVAHRCDCCSTVIEPGDSAVMFSDEAGRECWAHYGACPEPDLCRVTYDYNGEPRTTGDISEQQAIYFGMAMNGGRAAGIARVRLVRSKDPRRG